jgi:single-strand DNA-binding protein
MNLRQVEPTLSGSMAAGRVCEVLGRCTLRQKLDKHNGASGCLGRLGSTPGSDNPTWRIPLANFNQVTLIGRLTRDPEARTFASGGKVTNVGFVVNNRKKNSQTGQYEDDPMYIDVAFFNRGESFKLANLIEDNCKKGSQLMIQGELHLESWDDKNSGGKRSKHKIVADKVQLLDQKQNQGQQQHSGHQHNANNQNSYEGNAGGDGEGDGIPF